MIKDVVVNLAGGPPEDVAAEAEVSPNIDDADRHGTVGAVALDGAGRLAAVGDRAPVRVSARRSVAYRLGRSRCMRSIRSRMRAA